MATTNATTQERTADEDACDDCAELPEGWPCADCYIKDCEPITTERQ